MNWYIQTGHRERLDTCQKNHIKITIADKKFLDVVLKTIILSFFMPLYVLIYPTMEALQTPSR